MNLMLYSQHLKVLNSLIFKTFFFSFYALDVLNLCFYFDRNCFGQFSIELFYLPGLQLNFCAYSFLFTYFGCF